MDLLFDFEEDLEEVSLGEEDLVADDLVPLDLDLPDVLVSERVVVFTDDSLVRVLDATSTGFEVVFEVVESGVESAGGWSVEATTGGSSVAVDRLPGFHFEGSATQSSR